MINRGSGEARPISIGDPDQVSSWPFKEPEKKSAWNDNADPAVRDAPVALRDFEKDKAEKRTALIRERMSPPGALRLTPLLEEHRLRYGIPDGFFKSQAVFDRIFVFPIDQFDGGETYSPQGTIIRGRTQQLKDLQEGSRGILVSAGLTAADRLASHGIELGSIVTTNKNVPFARRCERLADGHEMFYLVMRDADLAGSETLAEQIIAGNKRIEDVGDPGRYEHQVATNDNGEWTTHKKQSVYVNDNW